MRKYKLTRSKLAICPRCDPRLSKPCLSSAPRTHLPQRRSTLNPSRCCRVIATAKYANAQNLTNNGRTRCPLREDTEKKAKTRARRDDAGKPARVRERASPKVMSAFFSVSLPRGCSSRGKKGKGHLRVSIRLTNRQCVGGRGRVG